MRRAISLSFSSPRSSVRIMGHSLIIMGSKALWISAMFSSCSANLSRRKSDSAASGGRTRLTTRASTFLL